MKPRPVHIEAERGLDALDVKHGACEPVGHGVDAIAPPACAEAAGATRGTTGLLLWTLAFSILRPERLTGGLSPRADASKNHVTCPPVRSLALQFNIADGVAVQMNRPYVGNSIAAF